MKSLRLGYSPWSSPENCHPFNAVFHELASLQDVPVADCDAIVLWGGTDINPHFYGQEPHPMTWYHEGGARDRLEWQWLHEAMSNGVPIIGVCRGAQMICAGVGGTLFQHVTGHNGGNHAMETKDGEVYQTPSAHHQMLNLTSLPEDEYELIAWSKSNRSQAYEDVNGKLTMPEGFKEPEVVLFPNIRALAIQSHPEWCDALDPVNQYYLDLVRELLHESHTTATA